MGSSVSNTRYGTFLQLEVQLKKCPLTNHDAVVGWAPWTVRQRERCDTVGGRPDLLHSQLRTPASGTCPRMRNVAAE
eukprot:gene13314-biopygen23038